MIRDLVRAGILLGIGMIVYRSGQKNGYRKGVVGTTDYIKRRLKEKEIL